MDGENQFHAIFGDAPCHIVHPSSLAVPSSHGGRFRVIGPQENGRSRQTSSSSCPIATWPAKRCSSPNELVTHVILPRQPNVKSAHYEVKFKQSHDWPVTMASVALVMSGTTVQAARGARRRRAGALALAAAEAVLKGKTVTEQVAAEAADAAVKTRSR